MSEGVRQDSADGNTGKWGRKLETGSKSVFFIYSNSVEFSRDVGKTLKQFPMCAACRAHVTLLIYIHLLVSLMADECSLRGTR